MRRPQMEMISIAMLVIAVIELIFVVLSFFKKK